ncbi:unnamed protein product [Gongylonema pulchrum]|uniref:Uncharacterized protein n=1 Tax=Gongylonema pulchrum TaxID=637853 RepID=A0A3P6SSL5_9BILA|nr:unnamed protein product [Gongylonema pulchrum]
MESCSGRSSSVRPDSLRRELETIKARELVATEAAAETRSVAVATDPLPHSRFRNNSHSGDDVFFIIIKKKEIIFAALLIAVTSHS